MVLGGRRAPTRHASLRPKAKKRRGKGWLLRHAALSFPFARIWVMRRRTAFTLSPARNLNFRFWHRAEGESV